MIGLVYPEIHVDEDSHHQTLLSPNKNMTVTDMILFGWYIDVGAIIIFRL